MNQSLILSGTDKQPVSVELLGDDELAAINGGLTPVMVGAAILGGILAAAAVGVVVGIAFYYFSRDE